MAVTLKDISDEAGINTGSVSHVLNNHPKAMELKAETRERIRLVAQNLGYFRNEMAHAIATGRTKIIAFISADMGATSYTGKIQEGVFEEASERGYAVSFYHLTSQNQQEIIRKISEWRIAGAVFHVADPETIAKISKDLIRLGLPFGTANLSSNEQAGIGVTTDDFQGAVDVMKHLAKLGHRRIAHITMKGDMEFVANRRYGYLEGMKQFANGTPPRIIESVTDNFKDICQKLLSEPEGLRPTAVFCVMDTVAMELMREAIRINVKIPEELSIVGFGNLDMAEYAPVPLTTVSQPFKEMGKLTAKAVIEAVENPKSTKRAVNLKLKTKLVARKSTAALKKFVSS
jgi:LacI family transcriptional regulator